VSPEILRRERDYDAGRDNQHDHLHPKGIGQATWLPVFLRSHGVSPLEIFLMGISQRIRAAYAPTVELLCCWTASRQRAWAGNLAAQGFAAELTDAFEVIPARSHRCLCQEDRL
jgi:hypothetical protein